MRLLHPDRRSILKALSLGTVASALGACRPVYDKDERTTWPNSPWDGVASSDTTLFPLGIQSGDITPDGAVLWTRYSGTSALTATVALWSDGQWTTPREWPATVQPSGAVHLTIDSFTSDLALAYQFHDEDGNASPVGYLKTAIAPQSMAPVVFGASSCMRSEGAPYPSLSRTAQAGPMDFFLWLGDTVYADGANTHEEYRAHWHENLQAQGFQDIFSSTPGVYTWDDHEVANNWEADTISIGQFAAASDAFFEHTPIRQRPEAPKRIWRSLSFGRTAEVFVLDCRGERDRDAGHYLSPQQLQWLMDGLSSSKATWKVIANSVPITNMPTAYDSPNIQADRWEGFAEQRSALLSHITEAGITGVLFLTGDLHQATFARVEAQGPASNLFEVFAGPGGSQPNIIARLIEDGEQFIYSEPLRNAVRLRLSSDGFAQILYIGEENEPLFEALINDHGHLLYHHFGLQHQI
jgi:alkaline phosphatase D